MDYHFNQGALTLFPGDWQDCSLHILRDKRSGLSVVISQAELSPEASLQDALTQQWQAVKDSARILTQSPFTARSVGANHDIEAIEVETQFDQSGQLLWQKQLAVKLDDPARLMVFTLSAQQAFTAEQTEQWQHLSHSVVLKHASQG